MREEAGGKKTPWKNLRFLATMKSYSVRVREAAGRGKRAEERGCAWVYTCPRSEPVGTQGFTAWRCLEAPKPGDSINQRAAADGAEMKGFPGQSVIRLERFPGQPPWGE